MSQIDERSHLLDKEDQTHSRQHASLPPSISLEESSDRLSEKELPYKETKPRSISSNHTVFLLTVLVIFTCSLGLSVWTSRTSSDHGHHDHTAPTLLSIQYPRMNGNNLTSRFVNAKESEVYSQLLSAPFENHANTLVQAGKNPILQVDKEMLSFHESLILRWDNGIDDTFVVALYCPADETNPKKFRDAATLAQLKWTHKQNVKQQVRLRRDRHLAAEDERQLSAATMNHLQDENEKWFIPSFPIVREDTCQFRLYQPVQHLDRTKSILRHGTSMNYLNTSSTDFVLNGTSPTIQLENGKISPTTLHLAFTTRPTEMRISFSTGHYPVSSKLVPVSIYGKDKSSVQNYHLPTDLMNGTAMKATGESSTYHASDLCQAPANIEQPGLFLDPGMLHSVVMENLDLDEGYYYKVGMMALPSDESDYSGGIVWSSVYSFRSATAKTSYSSVLNNAYTKPYAFLVYADQGCPGFGWDDGGARTAKWTSRELTSSLYPIRAVHHFGDLSYAMGSGHNWDHWMDMVSGIAARVPLMVGVGNHEYDYTSGGLGKDLSGVDTGDGFHPKWGDFGDDSSGECGVPASKR